ncbi:MAG: T9SS type A sorting domain-containing protein, partial [Bacteroidia bacterium]
TVLFASAQTSVSVHDVQYISPTDLGNCLDLSAYDGQTIKTVGVVMHDGNLTELSSGSVNGGYRPGVHILDTAAHGVMGNFSGVQIHGVYTDGSGQSQPVSTLDNLVAGMIIEVTGTVSNYQGETQIYPSDNSSVSVIGTTSAVEADTIDLGLLNDNTRTNKYVSGEEWEGSFVSFKDVTVVGVSVFSGNRVSFDVSDADGNTINVSDRFLVQKMASRTLVNPSSPLSEGTFVAPIIGTKYASLSGIIMHSQNGCSGGTGRGYELNPFAASHYKVGDTPPSISDVTRDPLVPTSAATVMISARIIDFNGTVDDQNLYYSDNVTGPLSAFTKVPMTLKSGSSDEYEASIPAFADGTIVRYYMTAEDNDANVSYEPFTAGSASEATAFYTVRDAGLTIADIQKVLDPMQDASPYNGKEVTVKGYVTASAKPYDLEDIYIQDKDATEWGGLHLTGNADLLDLWRTQEVEVTGTIQESFGFTEMVVSSVSKTGKTAEIAPIELPVSDSAGRVNRGLEKYESMLVKFVNSNGKVKISNPRLNPFGEYTIATDTGASFANSTKVQAGSKNSNNNSSLWVSVVSDSSLENSNGIMEVPLVVATKEMDMDALVGILYYGFSQYAAKPRNNDDLVGFSVKLDTTNYPEIVSVKEIVELGVSFYPNPVGSKLNITIEDSKPGLVSVRSLEGRTLIQSPLSGSASVNVSNLSKGLYILEFTNNEGQKATTKFIKL